MTNPANNPWSSLVTSLAALPAAAPKGAPRFQPRPKGVIRPGSATEAVLVFLRATPHRFYRHHEIVEHVGRSKVAVDWALIFLREQALVECIPDSIRNSKYMRYRAAPAAKANGDLDDL